MEDLGYMCSLENPGLEPSLTVLSAAGGGHVTSPAPPLTSFYDTHTAFCAEEVKLQDIDMRPRLDYYPFCEQSGIDLDVHSKLESKEKHDLQFLTNGVMFEIRKYVRRNIKKKAYSYFLYDILDYNFDMSFHNEKRYFFTKRLGFDVKRLAKTYYRDMASNPNHATDVFALYSKMPKERKKKETVNQPARKSERISKEKTCQLSSFERTNPYTDGTAGVGQMDDLGYMCSLENPGLEPSLTILSAAGGGHVSSPAAPLTSSYDTHTALCAGKVKLKYNNNMSVGQMDDLGYMCSLENPGLEALLTEQANVS
ncbi:uncharacterized protein LOC124465447 [Hypomesus transpacificus]|uniref:uncharacterized protein LOC124465447 n=1 Tax=Hypomesus transpacificus TaxID=137520 RepID=UPI001F07AD01|nr:uncharacterized protein LOC124465447 [Hypomesus transpacificus]